MSVYTPELTCVPVPRQYTLRSRHVSLFRVSIHSGVGIHSGADMCLCSWLVYSPAAGGQKVEVEYVQTFIAVS